MDVVPLVFHVMVHVLDAQAELVQWTNMVID